MDTPNRPLSDTLSDAFVTLGQQTLELHAKDRALDACHVEIQSLALETEELRDRLIEVAVVVQDLINDLTTVEVATMADAETFDGAVETVAERLREMGLEIRW